MPGSLIPSDLVQIQEFVGDHSGDFVLTHFLVSDGAKVGIKTGDQLQIMSVPSLVPAQRPDGRCVFLTSDEKCSIHPVSPFGCGYYDTHMDIEEGERRSKFCITEQLADHQSGGVYSQLCNLLNHLKLRAAPLVERRKAMEAMFE